MTDATTPTTVTLRRHPLRGVLWGFVLGLGLALTAVGQGRAALGTTPPIALLVAGVVLGTLWGTFGPARPPKGPPPATPLPVEDRTRATPPGDGESGDGESGDGAVGDGGRAGGG